MVTFKLVTSRFSRPAAATLSKRWKVGHSAWLTAGHAAAWRKPLLMARKRLTVASISSALANNPARSTRVAPCGESMVWISSSDSPPGLTQGDQTQLVEHVSRKVAPATSCPACHDQALVFVETQCGRR